MESGNAVRKFGEDEAWSVPRRRKNAGEAGRAAALTHQRIFEACDCVIDLAAAFFNVSGKELRKPGRTAEDVARVRQIAMYLAHVMLGLSMADVGKGFGRDRTTVVHACHIVEDMRDDIELPPIP